MRFDWSNPLARNTDPETSHEAAKTVSTTQLETIVLNVFMKAPNGLTADELSDRLPTYPLNSITPRIAPLIRKGFLFASGKRKGKSGKSQRVVYYAD